MNLILPPRALALVMSPLLILGGCGTQSSPEAGKTATGEVLPGTVSDAMLDTGLSQAEAPLAPAARSAADTAGLKPTATASDPATEANAGAAEPEKPTEDAAASVATPKPKPSADPKPSAP